MVRQLLTLYFSAERKRAQSKDLRNYIHRNHRSIIRKIDVRINFILVESNEMAKLKQDGLRNFPLLLLPSGRKLTGSKAIINFFRQGISSSVSEVPLKTSEQTWNEMLMSCAVDASNDQNEHPDDRTRMEIERGAENMMKKRSASMASNAPEQTFGSTKAGQNKNSYMQGPTRNSAPMTHRRGNDIQDDRVRPNNVTTPAVTVTGGVEYGQTNLGMRDPDRDAAFGVATSGFAGDPQAMDIDVFTDKNDQMMYNRVTAEASNGIERASEGMFG